MSEWQPIETAPKDGTKVFLWIPEYDDHLDFPGKKCQARRFESSWSGSKEHGYWENKYGNGPEYSNQLKLSECRTHSVGAYKCIEPSHWMPLPDPPKLS